MNTSQVTVVVLAAGASQRMGSAKLLLDINGVPLIRMMVVRAVAAKLHSVLVVIPDPDPGLAAALVGLPIQVVRNTEIGGPTSTSLHLGIRTLPGEVSGVVVLLSDMPHVSTEMIRAVADAGSDAHGPLAVSRYGDVFAPPLFFSRQLFPELLAWQGEGCGKQVVKRHQAEAIFLDWPAAALADIDTPQDYQRLVSELKQPPTLAPQGERL